MKTVAIIGCGRIANMAHLPALSKIDDVRIKYACDLIIEKAEAAKEKFPKIENTITDYKVALEDPEVDAVVYCGTIRPYSPDGRIPGRALPWDNRSGSPGR